MPGAKPAEHGAIPARPRRRYFVALVLSGRIAAEIDGLRRALQPELIERIPPHLTLVPPRNVADDLAPALDEHLRSIAGQSADLRLRLGPVETFAPVAPVVYLACSAPDGTLERLASALASGPLSSPPQRSERPFHAHVTLANRIEEPRRSAALVALAPFRCDVVLDRLSLLQYEAGPPRRWVEVADYFLRPPAVVGRGGVELELAHSSLLGEEAVRLLAGAGACPPAMLHAVPGQSLVVTAREGRRLVAVTAVVREGEAFILEAFCVVPDRRGAGIGGQLLRHVERVVRERRGSSLRGVAREGGDLAGFLRSQGFVPNPAARHALGSQADVWLERWFR